MLNVLSLFDGMSCGQIALQRSGIRFDRYYAAEIDKPAMLITKKNYPDTVFLGDVRKWREWDIDWASIGLLMGGSPCQGFSFAGKQLAFDDPRSVLFFIFVDILKHIKSVNPNVKFLLENVRMKREFLNVITEHMGVEPVFINSALVSAQNRRRYYWANWEFGQPEDRGIMLRDILEDYVNPSFNYSDKSIAYMERGNDKWQQAGKRRADRYMQSRDTEKAFTLTANFHKGVPYNYFCDTRIKGVTVDKRGVRPHQGDKHKSGIQEYGRVCFDTASSVDALTTSHSPKIIRLIPVPSGLKIRDKSKTIRVGGHNSPFGSKQEWDSPYQKITPESLVSEFVYRKLTPVECERLQTVPDNYTNGVSNTQRYKMLGNGWSVNTIVHILSSLDLPRSMPGCNSIRKMPGGRVS